jgi:hypothetical protein
MVRSTKLGFFYGVATPVGLACLAAIVYAQGSPAAAAFAVLMAVVISTPVAFAATVIFGLPIHALFARFRITSLAAHIAAGLCLSLLISGLELADEWRGGYENANQALLNHFIQFMSLISGPAAAIAFWFSARPDHSGKDSDRPLTVDTGFVRFVKWACLAFLGALAIGVTGSLINGGLSDHPSLENGNTPIHTETAPFESVKSAALVASIIDYAKYRGVRVGYYFMPAPLSNRPANNQLVMIGMTYPNAIKIIVTNAGMDKLSAFIYVEHGGRLESVAPIWSDFLPFLHAAVEQANATPLAELPRIASRGEGGTMEPPEWWDWRFHR